MDQATFERQRLEYLKKSAKGGKDDWWSCKEGKHLIRLGPPWNETGYFYKERIKHGDFKADLQVSCAENDLDPATGKIRACPVCSEYRKLKGNKEPLAKEYSKIIYPKTTVLWNVLLAKKAGRDPKNPMALRPLEIEKKFRMWELAPKWQAALMTEFSGDGSGEFWKYTDKNGNEHDNPLALTHPSYGRWILVQRIGDDKDTQYSFHVVTGPCRITEDREEMVAIGGSLHDLDSMVGGSSDEELAGFLAAAKKLARKRSSGTAIEDGDIMAPAPNRTKVTSAADLMDELGGGKSDPFGDDDVPF